MRQAFIKQVIAMKDKTLLHLCIQKDEENSCVNVSVLENLKHLVRVSSDSGVTPLHFVALGKNIELASWLLGNGATFQINEQAETPLHWACKTGYYAMISLFVEFMTTSEINQKDIEGDTALDWAVEYKTDDTPFILELLASRTFQSPKKSGKLFKKKLRIPLLI